MFLQIEKLGPSKYRELSESESSRTAWIIFAILFALPALITFFLYLKDNDYLQNKSNKEKCGRLYQDAHLKKSGSKYMFPLFMLERLMFVLIPIILYSYQGFQLMALISLKILVLMYYLHTKPWDLDRNTVRMKIFAESIHYFIFVFLMPLSDYTSDMYLKFQIAFLIIALIGLNALVNIILMVKNMMQNKAKIQKMSENPLKFDDIDVDVDPPKSEFDLYQALKA